MNETVFYSKKTSDLLNELQQTRVFFFLSMGRPNVTDILVQMFQMFRKNVYWVI